MNRRSNREPEPQPNALSRRAEGAPAARRDGLPIWLLALAIAVVLLWTCALLFRGTIAFAGQPSPDDLGALAPTSRATDSNTAPAPATITATQTATPTLTPLSPGTPTSFPAGPTLSPTPSPTATGSQGAESTAMPPVVRQVPLPTPTLPPPLPTDVPVAGEPHGDYGVTTSSCAGCHRAHSAGGLALRKTWPEETLCFSCHGAAGPGTDVEAAFAATANTATRIFKHDVAATTGVHRIGETAGSDFGGANRHVECEDCHDPHGSARGITAAPVLQQEMSQVQGVDPVWMAPGAPAGYTWLDDAEREYQVCFKCHSSFTQLPTYAPDGWDGSSYVADGLRKLTNTAADQVPDRRDMAQEFNPYNASFHPVVTTGRNQNIPAGSFVNGWSVDSMVYCVDCHTNADPSIGGTGPHGSPLLHLLSGSDQYQTASPDAPSEAGGILCFSCHDAADYYSGSGTETNFARNRANLHRQHSNNGTCYLCHDTHGSEQLHLLNLDSSIVAGSDTYFLPGYDGLPTNSQTFWQISPDGSEKTCWLVCHGHDHGRSSYPNVGD
ncbi:MAG: cytochrome c3 family protein [Anaerolineae bacterium]